ncbi:hypothetical protein [Desulfoluna spongiiphila]|nr:hypothetical protein [Desulfoluna spongiiphila]
MMGALVLKKFHLNNEAKNGEDCLHVIGRQGGVVAFLLSLMKIDPTTEIKCNDERVEVTQSSFFGRQTINIPLVAMTGVIGGFQKPKALFFAIIAVLFGGVSLSVEAGAGAAIASLVIAAVLAAIYVLKQEMALNVQNGGDTLWGLSFKRSVIENVTVDIDKVNEAVYLINKNVLASSKS